jgi:hypothetical protein
MGTYPISVRLNMDLESLKKKHAHCLTYDPDDLEFLEHAQKRLGFNYAPEGPEEWKLITRCRLQDAWEIYIALKFFE